MKKLTLITTLVLSQSVNAHIYWTVKPTGIIATTSGTLAVDIGKNIPTPPNPKGTEWVPCKNTFISFHKNADGSAFSSDSLTNHKIQDRMLSIALAAVKTKSDLRVAIKRDTNNTCYTTQIFD